MDAHLPLVHHDQWDFDRAIAVRESIPRRDARGVADVFALLAVLLVVAMTWFAV